MIRWPEDCTCFSSCECCCICDEDEDVLTVRFVPAPEDGDEGGW